MIFGDMLPPAGKFLLNIPEYEMVNITACLHRSAHQEYRTIRDTSGTSTSVRVCHGGEEGRNVSSGGRSGIPDGDRKAGFYMRMAGKLFHLVIYSCAFLL